MARTFHVIIEQDEDGVYIGKVPELAGCITQGSTLDELMKNVKEAIELCLEVQEKEKTKDCLAHKICATLFPKITIKQFIINCL